jgi:hypothetical protein
LEKGPSQASLKLQLRVVHHLTNWHTSSIERQILFDLVSIAIAGLVSDCDTTNPPAKGQAYAEGYRLNPNDSMDKIFDEPTSIRPYVVAYPAQVRNASPSNPSDDSALSSTMSMPAIQLPQAASRASKRRKLDVNDASIQTSPSSPERNNVSNPGNKIANSGHFSWRAAILEKQADLKSGHPGEQGDRPGSDGRNATKTSTQGRDEPVTPRSSHSPKAMATMQAQNRSGKPRSKTPPSHSKDLLEALSTRTHTSPDNDLPSPSAAVEMHLRNAQRARISRPAKHTLHARTGAGQAKAILSIPHGPSVQQKLSEKTTHMNPTPKHAGKQEHVVAGPSEYNGEAGNADTGLNAQKRDRKDTPVVLEPFRNGIRTRTSGVGTSTTSNGSHGKMRGITDPLEYSVQSRDSGIAGSMAPNHAAKLHSALAGPSGSSGNRSSDLTESIPSNGIQMQPLEGDLSAVTRSSKSSRTVSTPIAQPIDQRI